MSRNELVEAYRRGRISRRSFIKGMTAVGVSAVAATKMADDLRAAPAGPRGGQDVNRGADDVYETPTVAPTSAPSQLPSTGAGGPTDGGSSLLKPIAVAGAAAAAFVAAKYRKVRGAESE
jgi:hypothetical protein